MKYGSFKLQVQLKVYRVIHYLINDRQLMLQNVIYPTRKKYIYLVMTEKWKNEKQPNSHLLFVVLLHNNFRTQGREVCTPPLKKPKAWRSRVYIYISFTYTDKYMNTYTYIYTHTHTHTQTHTHILAANVIRTQPLQSPSDDLGFVVTWPCRPLSTSHRSAR